MKYIQELSLKDVVNNPEILYETCYIIYKKCHLDKHMIIA